MVSLDSSRLVMPELWSQASHYCMLVLQLSGLHLLPPAGPGGVGVEAPGVDVGDVLLQLGGLLVPGSLSSPPLHLSTFYR